MNRDGPSPEPPRDPIDPRGSLEPEGLDGREGSSEVFAEDSLRGDDPALGPLDDSPLDAADDDDPPPWDANDPLRQRDQMAPPLEPCECYCLHCNRTFMSDQIWFQRVIGDPAGFEGFWMCPTPNCSGAGFTFDIFPTDPSHPANAGWVEDDDEDVNEVREVDGFDDDSLEEGAFGRDDGSDREGTYDPEETKYKLLDEELGDGENDFAEGDEWKLGLEPGQAPPPQMYWPESARKNWEEEQRRYDSPDERPRVLDWTNRKDLPGKDDIPF